MKIKQKVFGNRIVSDQRYRIIITAAFSFSVNLLYALYHGALGIANRSLWFITMCAYYTVLCTMRFSAVLCERKSNSTDSFDTEYFVIRLTGILLAVLSFVLTGVIYLSLAENIVTKHDSAMMITIAAYTFTKIVMAIIHAVKQRRNPSPLLAVIRSIGYAEAAASVFTLQRSMLASFGSAGGTDAHLMNVLTGAAVCLFIFMLGITRTRKGIKRKGV